MMVPQRLARDIAVYFYYQKLGIGGRGTVRHCTPHKQGYKGGLEFPGGTGWKPVLGADLLALAAKVNDEPAPVNAELNPSRA